MRVVVQPIARITTERLAAGGSQTLQALDSTTQRHRVLKYSRPGHRWCGRVLVLRQSSLAHRFHEVGDRLLDFMEGALWCRLKILPLGESKLVLQRLHRTEGSAARDGDAVSLWDISVEKLRPGRKIPFHDSARRKRGESVAKGGVAHDIPVVTEVWQRRLEGHAHIACDGGSVVFEMNADDKGVPRIETKVDPNVRLGTVPSEALLQFCLNSRLGDLSSSTPSLVFSSRGLLLRNLSLPKGRCQGAHGYGRCDGRDNDRGIHGQENGTLSIGNRDLAPRLVDATPRFLMSDKRRLSGLSR